MKNWEMVNDEDFLRYEFVDFLLSVVGINQVSISSTFCMKIFCTKVLFLELQSQNITREKLPEALSYEKF